MQLELGGERIKNIDSLLVCEIKAVVDIFGGADWQCRYDYMTGSTSYKEFSYDYMDGENVIFIESLIPQIELACSHLNLVDEACLSRLFLFFTSHLTANGQTNRAIQVAKNFYDYAYKTYGFPSKIEQEAKLIVLKTENSALFPEAIAASQILREKVKDKTPEGFVEDCYACIESTLRDVERLLSSTRGEYSGESKARRFELIERTINATRDVLEQLYDLEHGLTFSSEVSPYYLLQTEEIRRWIEMHNSPWNFSFEYSKLEHGIIYEYFLDTYFTVWSICNHAITEDEFKPQICSTHQLFD